ncbi:hypothetical protein ElyMa_001636300 [Elysia marginata]|uniref:Uncharacterized protein n=1 Tax=Elysia marginata TaxID=1093978 RepID=A0AAV4JQS5_9GAST|nr:hypothetical protein ElyMa_001636300 [Elysia marginata]
MESILSIFTSDSAPYLSFSRPTRLELSLSVILTFFLPGPSLAVVETWEATPTDSFTVADVVAARVDVPRTTCVNSFGLISLATLTTTAARACLKVPPLLAF